LLNGLLAKRGQHMRDVVHERRIRTDDEDAAQLLAVRVEKPRRAMEPDRCLAGAGPALHDERAVGVGGDQPVLIRLDRRHDVAHPPFAAAFELFEQEVRDSCAFDNRTVEGFVGDVDDAATVRAIAAPLRDSLRVGRRCGVERSRRRSPPVDDEHLVLVVVHPAASDIERPKPRIERQAPEAQPPVSLLEGPHPPLRPRLHRNRCELGRHRIARALERRAHPVECLVGAVDVGLFLLQLGMRHGRLTVAA
jgi:hypothetical protein